MFDDLITKNDTINPWFAPAGFNRGIIDLAPAGFNRGVWKRVEFSELPLFCKNREYGKLYRIMSGKELGVLLNERGDKTIVRIVKLID